MPQKGTGILLYAGILSFDPFEICAGRLINSLQCFKNVILVIRFFVNRSPDPLRRGDSYKNGVGSFKNLLQNH
jgi:hypothetical protein